MTSNDDSSGSGRGSKPPAARRSGSTKKVTLQFAGPKLALPGEPEPKSEDALRLDLPGDASEPQPSSSPRLEEATAADAWSRLRASEGPRRPKQITPPSFTRDEALDLVSRRSRPPSTPGLDLRSEMADRYALGDYSGALRVAELVLGKNPEDGDAIRYAEGSRERLIQLYSARLASISATSRVPLLQRIAKVSVPEHEIRWLGLDHRQGFLLSRLDGHATIADLVDLSGMTQLEVLRTLVELVETRAITVG